LREMGWITVTTSITILPTIHTNPSKATSSIAFGEHVMRCYRWPTNWSVCSWGLSNNILLPSVFIPGQTNTSFERCTSPCLISRVTSTPWRSIPFWSTRHTVLELSYRKRWIGRGGLNVWPTCSADFTSLISACRDRRNGKHEMRSYNES
jgi:hypothetical protein